MIELPSHVPLFPLPNVVLFPQMPLPLHVFEPRYRKMVADARAGNHVIGMALLRPGWEPNYYGRPPVFPVGCAGQIEQCEELPDGKYNLLLRGRMRFTIGDEQGDKPYRVAEIAPRPETVESPDVLDSLRTDVIAAIERASEQEVVVLHGRLPPEMFINALSQSLELTPIEKQSLLDCDSVLERGRRLIELLRFKRLERRRGGSPRAN